MVITHFPVSPSILKASPLNSWSSLLYLFFPLHLILMMGQLVIIFTFLRYKPCIKQTTINVVIRQSTGCVLLNFSRYISPSLLLLCYVVQYNSESKSQNKCCFIYISLLTSRHGVCPIAKKRVTVSNNSN